MISLPTNGDEQFAVESSYGSALLLDTNREHFAAVVTRRTLSVQSASEQEVDLLQQVGSEMNEHGEVGGFEDLLHNSLG